MKIKLSFFIVLTSLFIFFGSAKNSFAQTEQITGGYGDADVTDKDVIKAAKFAVKKSSQIQNATITLRSITKAQIQVVAGINYKLCLEINYKRKSDKKTVRRYAQTVIYRNLKNVHSITNWMVSKNSLDLCK